MTIDDFDVNDISNKLTIREENDARALEAAHNDGHNDAFIDGPYHYDTAISVAHDDAIGNGLHDDGHYDIFDDVVHDDACPGYKQCPE